ncbi:BnaA06g19670D [Brassica napus]|uniref:(rape) hypothetical protein n=1 Tax=Brassica napus TaxID=3708 RepID=A0A078GZK4_BRANA|nr:unnamed protein product [Brassica napus]CDY30946.1 BnaA06g19670D [Brassica napus]
MSATSAEITKTHFRFLLISNCSCIGLQIRHLSSL